jgi:hypothetical protein
LLNAALNAICSDMTDWNKGLCNVVIEWLTLLLLIRDVPDSNFGPETSYFGIGFSWFFSVPL